MMTIDQISLRSQIATLKKELHKNMEKSIIMNEEEIATLPDEVLMDKILVIRNMKVMLDRDLAGLYGVETKRLKEQVRRNIERFPKDFMFELSEKEHELLKRQIDNRNRGQHSKYPPYAFTEHGVLMLSSVLNTERAIKVNIQIMRVYVRIREMIKSHKDLIIQMDQLELIVSKQDEKISLVFEYLRKFIDIKEKPRKEVGFKRKDEL